MHSRGPLAVYIHMAVYSLTEVPFVEVVLTKKRKRVQTMSSDEEEPGIRECGH